MEFEGLYRDIVETSRDGIWVFDLEGRTLYANPQLAEMFGVDRDEFLGLTVFDSLDEEGAAQFHEHLALLRQQVFNPDDVECRFVCRDGSTLWVLVRESPLYAADGSLEGILHRLSDYTGRRQVVDALLTSKRQLAEAQRIARIGSWEWDVERDEITGSEGLYALYGLDPSAFPASYDGFLQIVHPDDRVLVDDAVRRALGAGGEFVFEARVQGETDWVWTRGRGVAQSDSTGRVVAMSGTHQDISEAKTAEAALQDQVTQNVLMQAVAITANEARTLEEVLGQARSLVLLHDDWERARGFLPTADGAGVEPLYVSDADRDEDLATPEVSAIELTLAERVLRERASVWDEQRLTIGFPVLFADEVRAIITITSAPPLYRHELIQSMAEQVAVQLGRVAERERAERELADARDGAMEASRQKTEFLATMSHEIRTPLNGVIGLNDLLLRTDLDADQLRLASGVQVASRALLSVINDILDFSKIEAGKLELERVEFDVRSVLEQVAHVLGESARAKGLELVVACHPDVPAQLVGDPTRLAQVLTNLGSNAVKFTERGEVFVRATAGTAGSRLQLRVEVHDTGVGIDPADWLGLFDPFTQADASTTRVHGGTGLGLAISREIVDALGGEIGLESEPGHGSLFWFTAPFDVAPDTHLDPGDELARSWLAGRRALVVDANAHTRLALDEQLRWWQLRPQDVCGADEAARAMALAHAQGDPFEVVVLDLGPPGCDGARLAEELRAEPAYDDATLLMVTTSSPLGPAQQRELGVAQCLTKPVLASQLRAALLHELAGVEPRAAEAEAVAEEPGERRRILVVEDNPVNQMVAVGLLAALGYEAETANDGLEALDLFEPDRFAAVLMDVQMPRMDGYAATRAIRQVEPADRRLPILAMTAAAVEGERERCLAAGMDDFLTKPVDPTALATVLGEWLGDAPAEAAEPPAGPPTVPPGAPVPVELRGLDTARLDMLRDLDPGDTTYLDRAIGNFVANTPGALATISDAATAGDRDTLRQAAHKLAGSALNLGVGDAGATAQAIELACDEGTTEGTAGLVVALADALERGRAALLAYQATYAGHDASA